MTKPCPCCNALRWEERWPGFVICRTCGLMTVEGHYPLEELKKEYGEDYFRGREYVDYVADAAVQQKLLAAHFRRMTRYVARGSAVLEVGCAYGYFLDLLRSEYPGSVGIDVSAGAVAAARARGLDAREGDLLELDLPGRFGAVCLWDTVEHLPAPDAVLRRGVELLSAGGHLFLTTGDFGSWLARAQGLRWRQVHPPTHLFYFTRRSLTLLCQRIGLTVVALDTVAVHRRLSSSLRGWQQRYPGSQSARLAGWLDRVLPGRVREYDFPLNLGDTMFLAARRTS